MDALQCPPKPKRECKVSCNAKVDVDLHAKPEAFCFRKRGSPVRFPVELEIDVNPRCKLRHVKDISKGCKHICIFEVELDFDCEAKVRHGFCEKPRNEVELQIEIPVSPECKVVSVCDRKRRGHDGAALEQFEAPRAEKKKKERKNAGIAA